MSLRNLVARLPWMVTRQSSHSVTCRMPSGVSAHVFALGALVVEQDDLLGDALAILEDATSLQALAATREHYEIRVEPGHETPLVDWDRIHLTELDDASIQVAALLMAQSVALERYERGIEAIIDESLALTRDLYQRGRPPWRRGLPVRRVANLAAERLELARFFFMLDRPESTWESPVAARIYDLLFAHLELRDRHEALMHKLHSVQSTLEIIIDLWQSRRARLLEWAILLLIALEVVMAITRGS